MIDNNKPRDHDTSNTKSDSLSKKAAAFIEKRRGDRSIIEYVNLVFENISDKSGSSIADNGHDLLQIIETSVENIAVEKDQPKPDVNENAIPIVKEDANNPGINEKIQEIIRSMKNSFPERIPYDIFSKKCLDMGIPTHNIEAVVQENRRLFLITARKNNDYGNILIILIYHGLKKIYQDKSASQYYGICLERGLTINDIRFAESAMEVVIPDLGEDSFGMDNSIMAPVEKMLFALLQTVKKEYPHAMPVSEFLQRWDRAGLLSVDVDQLIKVYTHYLLSSYNDDLQTKEKTDATARKKIVNEHISTVLKEMSTQYGNTIPQEIFRQKCVEHHFDAGELEYSIKALHEYKDTSDIFEDIKYMNNKAYMVLLALRTRYPGKIPYTIFLNRCKAIGLTKEEIIEAVHQCGTAMFSGKIEEEPYLRALDDMILKHKANSTDTPPNGNP